MIKQVSIFIENSEGQLADVTEILGKNDIDIRALHIAESTDFGVLRLIVNDCEKASGVLSENVYVSTMTEVAAVSVPDRPGALSEVLRYLQENQLDISYMYSVFSRISGRAFMVIKVDDPLLAEDILMKKGIHIAQKEELDIK